MPRSPFLNNTQIALDILRGIWLLHDADALLPYALKFLERKTSEAAKNEYTPSLSSGSRSSQKKSSSDQKKVLVLPIHGALTKYETCTSYGTTDMAATLIEYASKDDIVGVVLDIDSPGGSSNAIMPMVNAINQVKAMGKPIIVHTDFCASNVQEGQEGTASAESMDGIETILVDAKKAGNTKINFFRNAKNLLEIEDDGEFLEAIHTYATSISPLFKSAIMKIKCSQQIIDRYNACDFKVYAKYTGEKIGNSIRFSKFTLEPMECMYSSPILIATPDVNMVMLVDRANAKNCINDIQKRDYKVRIFGEYSLSVGFLISEAVFAYVPDGYDPSAAVISDPLKYSGNWYNGGDGTASVNDEGETE